MPVAAWRILLCGSRVMELLRQHPPWEMNDQTSRTFCRAWIWMLVVWLPLVLGCHEMKKCGGSAPGPSKRTPAWLASPSR